MRNFTLLLLLVIGTHYSTTAQTRCASFESILVDACGSPEGINEMFRFRVGPNNLNTANLSVTWSSNPWLGVCQNAQTAENVVAWNRTIQSCGLLVEPVGGVLPAGKEVLFITSETVDTLLYSFAALHDTLIVLFQCGATTVGHFKNYQAGAGARTTILSFSGTGGCSDTATYIVDSLINQNGIHSASSGDGATANFSNGIVTYSNQGCTPVVPVLSVSILTNDTSVCPNRNILLHAVAANYKNLKWVGGTGTFSFPDSLNTTYTPGANDAFPVSLILRAYQSCTGDSLSDTIKISRMSNPVSLSSPGNTITCSTPQITITATGTGLTYDWGGGNNTSTKTVTGSGIYTVTATDAVFGCTTILSDTIGQNITVPNASIAPPTALSCHVPSVTLTASSTPTGATYNWGGGVTTALDTVTAIGNYIVTVTDPVNGCAATASATVISSGGSVGLTPTHQDAGCNNSGSAMVTVTSGTSPYTYIWNTNDTTASISSLGAGTYIVTVTDASGCSGIESIAIAASGALNLTPTITDTHCGLNNGSISITSNGTAPFRYHWNTGDTTSTVSNLASSTYLVTVTDAGSCTGTASLVVGPSTDSTVIISSDKLIMCSGDTAHLCAPAGYASYNWNLGGTGQCIATTLAGNYYVTATDNGGCTATSNHISISVHSLPPVSISVNGDTLRVYAATTIQWYLNGSAISGATADVYIASVGGNYTVAVTDTNGCRAVSTAAVVTVGINDIKDEQLGFYPNPSADGNWTLQVGTSLIQSEIEIVDNEGRIVYKSEIRDLRTEISLSVSRGIYLVHVYNSESNIYRKLIKL
ncbi:MAG: hypothetical protein JWO06_1798 [Bacteroidota bacterium]|nr:hypothetical protein [Bacteroidota bacterium]